MRDGLQARRGRGGATASTIGDQELALVRHIADRGSASVAEAVDEFGTSRGLARSTVLTMMERLRKKGYLSRQMADGARSVIQG